VASGKIIDEPGLTRLINASGAETVVGASPMRPKIISAIAAILPHAADMAELQRVLRVPGISRAEIVARVARVRKAREARQTIAGAAFSPPAPACWHSTAPAEK
jgi:seryl-tRNA(Sec) selenium transferase